MYGRFVVNRHCAYQAEHLIKTGYPHIQDELAKILTISRTLPENCVVVDVGANIGLVSVPVAQTIKARGGVVHAMEAQRMISYALCGAAALNDLDNLIVSNRAIGAALGTIKVPLVDYSVAQDFGMVSLVDQHLDRPSETVSLCTIDGLGLARLDFLKVDVEGMEIDVLTGAREQSAATIPGAGSSSGKSVSTLSSSNLTACRINSTRWTSSTCSARRAPGRATAAININASES